MRGPFYLWCTACGQCDETTNGEGDGDDDDNDDADEELGVENENGGHYDEEEEEEEEEESDDENDEDGNEQGSTITYPCEVQSEHPLFGHGVPTCQRCIQVYNDGTFEACPPSPYLARSSLKADDDKDDDDNKDDDGDNDNDEDKDEDEGSGSGKEFKMNLDKKKGAQKDSDDESDEDEVVEVNYLTRTSFSPSAPITPPAAASPEVYCRWCGDGVKFGLLRCCACPKAFCIKCLERNLGASQAAFAEDLCVAAESAYLEAAIASSSSASSSLSPSSSSSSSASCSSSPPPLGWLCVVCDPSQLIPVRQTHERFIAYWSQRDDQQLQPSHQSAWKPKQKGKKKVQAKSKSKSKGKEKRISEEAKNRHENKSAMKTEKKKNEKALKVSMSTKKKKDQSIPSAESTITGDTSPPTPAMEVKDAGGSGAGSETVAAPSAKRAKTMALAAKKKKTLAKAATKQSRVGEATTATAAAAVAEVVAAMGERTGGDGGGGGGAAPLGTARPHQNKPIKQLDPIDGHVIQEFASGSVAASQLNLTKNQVKGESGLDDGGRGKDKVLMVVALAVLSGLGSRSIG
jgi:hypothetical protein